MWSIISKDFRFVVLDTTSAKQRAQLCCFLKFVPNHTAQLSFCFKLSRIVKKLNIGQKTVRNYPVARNWRQTAQLSFGLKFPPSVKQLKIVQNKAHNCKLTEITLLNQKRANIFCVVSPDRR